MWCANSHHEPLFMSEESVLVARFDGDGKFPLTIDVYNKYHCHNCGATVMQSVDAFVTMKKFEYGRIKSEEAYNWIAKVDYFIDREEYNKALILEVRKDIDEDTIR